MTFERATFTAPPELMCHGSGRFRKVRDRLPAVRQLDGAVAQGLVQAEENQTSSWPVGEATQRRQEGVDQSRQRRRSDLDAGQTVVLEAQRADDGLKVNHRGNVPAGALHFVAFKPGRSSCHDVSVLSDGMALHHLHTRAHLTALSSMSTTRSMRR